MDWISWLQEWGNAFYPLAFFWAFFEGETFVIFGGIASTPEYGIINLYWLVASVWIGSFLGDQVWFWMGRRWGAKALARFPSAECHADRVLRWLERYGVGFILVFRFLYGVRNIASVAIGTSRMPWSRFLFWNFIAAGLWAWTFAGAGYMFGQAAASVGENGPKILLLAGLGIGGLVILFKSVRWVNRRRAASASQA